MVILTCLEATGQVIDAGRQQSHLDFGNPCAALGALEIGNDLRLLFGRTPSNSLSLKRRCPGLIES